MDDLYQISFDLTKLVKDKTTFFIVATTNQGISAYKEVSLNRLKDQEFETKPELEEEKDTQTEYKSEVKTYKIKI